MTWTYTSDPAGDTTDEVRFLVGDTDTTDQLVQNEEIEYALSAYPKPTGKPAYLAAAAVADGIAAKFARRADRSLGSLSIQAKQQRDHYVELAQTLRQAHASSGQATGDTRAPYRLGIPLLSGGGPTVLGG